MTRWSPLALVLAGCLSSPPASTESPPGADGAPGPGLRLLGTFARDTFTHDSVEEDLVTAVVYDDSRYIIRFPASGGGLEQLLERAQIIPIGFEPADLTGADANGDNQIDLVVVGATGDLAVLANDPEGLVEQAIDVSLDSGAPLHDVTTAEAPDLAGEERLFLAGPDGIWMSDPLDATGVIHFDELTPQLSNVAEPAAFWAGHDDEASWYVGFGHGTAIDVWPVSGLSRVVETDLIGSESPEPASAVHWRRFSSPVAVNFFGILPQTNRVAWVSRAFTAAEDLTTQLDTPSVGGLRDLSVTGQPEGFDLMTVSEEPEGELGVQVTASLTTPADPPGAMITTSLATALDTTLPLWVRAAAVTSAPYAGTEILVFDEAGRVLCLEFDAGHAALSSCGEADLRDHMPGWIAALTASGASTSGRPGW